MLRFMRKRTGAVVCPSCGRLVDVNEPVCPYCGRPSPGMFGYGPALQRLLGGFDLSTAVVGGCVVLYVLSLLIDFAHIHVMAGMFDFLSPSGWALYMLGMTGGAATQYGHWWTLLTAVFLHGSLLHLLFNMVVTRQFLPQVMDLYGSARAWVIFVVAGMVGFAVSNLAAGVPTIGASGAIAAVLGGYILMYPRARVLTLVFLIFFVTIVELPAVYVLGFWFLTQLYFGVAGLATPLGGEGVAYFAHVGGFVFGLLVIRLFYLRGHRGPLSP